jgi:hypothetical protein
MKRARTISTVLFGLLLLLGPGVAARADCCPPLDASGPDLAATGCCGRCPTALAPTPEPASLTAKAAHVPVPAFAGAAASPVVVALAIADRVAPADPSPPEPPVSHAAPLRL